MSDKCLYVSCVGTDGQANLRKVLERFDSDVFDFLIIAFDSADFSDAVYANCEIIRDSAPLFPSIKKHITPERVRGYRYVFFWMDDIDILDFSPTNFLKLMERYKLEVAQPGILPSSEVPQWITAARPHTIGRRTDFIEIMVPVFRSEVWCRWYELIEKDRYPWGWGYDKLMFSFCNLTRVAIIDCEVVAHLRLNLGYHAEAMKDMNAMQLEHKAYQWSRDRQFCELRSSILYDLLIDPFVTTIIRLDRFAYKVWHRCCAK